MSKSKKERLREADSNEELQPEGETGDEIKISVQSDDTGDTDDAVPEDVADAAVDQTAESEAEIADLKEQLLRKQADFENFRKRMFREREEAAKYANSKLLLDLVEIIDNFERAIKSSEESQDFPSFHEGIEIIEHQFTSMLDSKYGLKRIESIGVEFDPEKHEAIAAEEREDCDTQMVIEDYQRGYMLHDRVLRSAKVRVAVPASNAAHESQESDDQDETDT